MKTSLEKCLQTNRNLRCPIFGTLDQLLLISIQRSLNLRRHAHSVTLPRAGGLRVWFGPDVTLRIWDGRFSLAPISRIVLLSLDLTVFCLLLTLLWRNGGIRRLALSRVKGWRGSRTTARARAHVHGHICSRTSVWYSAPQLDSSSFSPQTQTVLQASGGPEPHTLRGTAWERSRRVWTTARVLLGRIYNYMKYLQLH